MKALAVAVSVLVLILSGCGEGPTGTSPAKDKNVILIILDTLRADHLSCYGYFRETSPTIDSLAENGTLWLNAISQAPWTLPAHASIWTGLSVKAHGTNHIGGIEGFDMKLDTELPSLPSEIQSAGIQTAGFTTFVLLSEEFGFSHGFDHYDCEGSGNRTAEAVFDAFLLWLDDQAEEKNFFAVLHLYDIHSPYAPEAPFDTAFSEEGAGGADRWILSEDGCILNPGEREHLESMYDGEILYTDHQIQRLLTELKNRGVMENTVLIITADHGEEFLEHGGVGHGHALYQEQIHVPLIMAGSGIQRGRTVDTPVGLYDIMPTVLTLFGIPVPETVEGTSILEAVPEERYVPSGGVSPDRFFLTDRSLDDFQSCAVTLGTCKAIAYMERDSIEQYDLLSDPGELSPESADSGMADLVLYHWATPRVGNPEAVGDMTPEINSTLRDLGYIR